EAGAGASAVVVVLRRGRLRVTLPDPSSPRATDIGSPPCENEPGFSAAAAARRPAKNPARLVTFASFPNTLPWRSLRTSLRQPLGKGWIPLPGPGLSGANRQSGASDLLYQKDWLPHGSGTRNARKSEIVWRVTSAGAATLPL